MSRNKVYLIIQTVLCVAVAALLCLSVIRLYREGLAVRESTDALAWIYTRERVAEQFARIALPFFGSIGFMIAGLVLGIKDPALKAPAGDIQSTRDLLAIQYPGTTGAIQKERTRQRWLLAGGWTGFGLCMIPVLIYVVDPAHFPADDLESMFSSLLPGILPWIALGLGCLMLFSFLRSRSMTREVGLLKDLAAGSSTGEAQADKTMDVSPDGSRKRLVMWVRIIVLAAAAAMIIAGALNGSLRDVLIKAINLCTECIGLG